MSRYGLRCRNYVIDDVTITACPRGGGDSYVASANQGREHVARVYREGSRWIHAGYPGKKWITLGQALQYGATQARQGR